MRLAVFGWPKDWRSSRLRAAMWLAIGTILLAPLAAMRFTDEVAWTPGDFAAAALLLAALGAACELAARSRLAAAHKALLCLALVAVAAVVWAHGAVGVF